MHFRRLDVEVSINIRINVGHSFTIWFSVHLILFLLSICRCICLVKIDFHRSSPTSIHFGEFIPSFCLHCYCRRFHLSQFHCSLVFFVYFSSYLWYTCLTCKRIDFSHFICYFTSILMIALHRSLTMLGEPQCLLRKCT